MKTKTKRDLLIATSCMIAFTIWTVLVCLVDVRAIGPLDSKIGFATLNGDFHRLIGVHLFWYTLTDALSILPFCIVIGFGMLGLCQWIKRRDIRSVDLDILILGFFYIAVFTMFLAFEKLCINYRPVLIDGVLEASYPSSTTMLVACVLPTAILQLKKRIKHKILQKAVVCFLAVFTVFMIAARVISGVHWLSDVIGGVLISTALVFYYRVLNALI